MPSFFFELEHSFIFMTIMFLSIEVHMSTTCLPFVLDAIQVKVSDSAQSEQEETAEEVNELLRRSTSAHEGKISKFREST